MVTSPSKKTSTPLFLPVSELAFLVPKVKKALIEIGDRLIDLLLHLPKKITKIHLAPNLNELDMTSQNQVIVTPIQIVPSRGRRPKFSIIAEDDHGEIELLFFNLSEKIVSQMFPVGKKVTIRGTISPYKNRLQMIHPKLIRKDPPQGASFLLSSEYLLPRNMSSEVFSNTLQKIFEACSLPKDWLDTEEIPPKNNPSFFEALYKIHFPQTEKDIEDRPKFLERMASDELLADQLSSLIIKKSRKYEQGIQLHDNNHIINKYLNSLPFDLTKDQKNAWEEIYADLTSPKRMARLLQGDVGSGKTILAILSLLMAASSGKQGALLAPTEVLARQHFNEIKDLEHILGIKVFLCLGQKYKTSAPSVDFNEADVIIGTHALMSNDRTFKNLGCVVIDEQHRFGVDQRIKLVQKGQGVNALYMSATPIPRTLSLTLFGDMDVSTIKEKPPCRKVVDTRCISLKRIDEVVESLERILKDSKQIYWVCPLVEESESLDLISVNERFECLKERFGHKVGLLHGQLKPLEKEKALEAFNAKKISLLVSTTVIEVGVNVPDAKVIIIENAERFGLAQLHQLRGRVGRGNEEGYCLLLYPETISEMGYKRLLSLKTISDGFALAEMDLKFRGSGESTGKKQSGWPQFRFSDLRRDYQLLSSAHHLAQKILKQDPQLLGKFSGCRFLLEIFERTNFEEILSSG